MSKMKSPVIAAFIIISASILFCGCKDTTDLREGIDPPGKAANPQPADTAVDVAPTAVLRWQPGENAYMFHIYLSTDRTAVENADAGSPEYRGMVGTPFFDPPGDLSLDTTYYWRVDCANAAAAVKGDTWSFATVVPPPVPAAGFTADPTTGQAPLAVTFTDTSTGLITSWSWDLNGDGSPDSSVRNPSCTYTQAGTFTVSLTVTGPGGADTETKTNYIIVTEPPPVADFIGSPTSGPAPLTVQFTDQSTGTVTQWFWDFNNDGLADSALQNPSQTYLTDGTYSVKLTVVGPSGTDSKIRIDYITVGSAPPPAPSAAFSATPTSGEAPLMVSFTDESTGSITSWSWDFGDGGTSTEQNPDYEYTNPGTYTVSLTVTGPGGNDTETKTDYITVSAAPLPPVAAFIGSPTEGTSPLLVSFTDLSTGSITSWSWNFGDGNTSTDQNPQHTYTTAGIFTVSLTVDGPTGSDGEVKLNYITVYDTAMPEADFVGDPTTGVAPLAVSFTDLSSSQITSWAWDFDGFGVDSTAQNPTWLFATPGTYDVKLTVSGPGGTDSNIKYSYITVNWPAPVANFTATPTAGLAPLTVSFTDASSGNITAWEWDFNNDTVVDSYSQNATHTYDSEGTYSVALTVIGPGGEDIETKLDYITVNWPPPVANFSADPTTGTVGTVVSFTNLSTGSVTSWEWDFGDSSLDSSNLDTSHQYTSAGWYTVKLSITGPGGSDMCVKEMHILTANNIWYVDMHVAVTTGDGTSWDEAFRTIQQGLDAAGDYDLVFVADGTYTGTSNRNLDFSGKAIYLKSTGGFYVCRIDCQNSGRGLYFHSGETPDAVVQGFTIENGNVADHGGGIRCENTSSPTIMRCRVRGNRAAGGISRYGGGIYSNNSDPIISECTITSNSADFRGGGISCYLSDPVIRNCIIKGNLCTTGEGGGISCTSGSPFVANCLIVENSACNGGAIRLFQDSNPTITNCTISANTATGGSYGGGGIFCWDGSSPVVNNTVLWANSTTVAGNEIWTEDSSSIVTLNWCNYANSPDDIGGSRTVTANDCINSDPFFVEAISGYYRVKGNSPCIDRGKNSFAEGAGLQTDLGGYRRMQDGNGLFEDWNAQTTSVDIGAYELAPETCGYLFGEPLLTVEVIFVVDRSNSMRGAVSITLYDENGDPVLNPTNMDVARVGVIKAIQSLATFARFAIVAFSTLHYTTGIYDTNWDNGNRRWVAWPPALGWPAPAGRICQSPNEIIVFPPVGVLLDASEPHKNTAISWCHARFPDPADDPNIEIKGGTCSYDGLSVALGMTSAPAGPGETSPTALKLITDGIPSFVETTAYVLPIVAFLDATWAEECMDLTKTKTLSENTNNAKVFVFGVGISNACNGARVWDPTKMDWDFYPTEYNDYCRQFLTDLAEGTGATYFEVCK